MAFKQRLLEGILIAVVSALIATSIGGVSVLLYSELVNSRKQLKETTMKTKQLNESSNTGIDRMNVIEDSISSLMNRINELENKNTVLSKVNAANGDAIKLLTEVLEKASFSNKAQVSSKIKKTKTLTAASLKSLKKLPKIDKEKIQMLQKEQQIQLNNFRHLQTQQQQRQKEW